jgi:hypothetical protein
MRVSETWAHQNSTELPAPSFQQRLWRMCIFLPTDLTASLPETHRRSCERWDWSHRLPARLFFTVFCTGHPPMRRRLHCITICATADEIDRKRLVDRESGAKVWTLRLSRLQGSWTACQLPRSPDAIPSLVMDIFKFDIPAHKLPSRF